MRKIEKEEIRKYLLDYVDYLEQREYDLSEQNEETNDIKKDICGIRKLIGKIEKEIC